LKPGQWARYNAPGL